jgi:hypothetical protein
VLSKPVSLPLTSQGARDYSIEVVVGASLIALLLVGVNAIVGSDGIKYPAAIASIMTFALVPIFIPAARIDTRRLVSPRNWALFAFGVTLLAMPILIQSYGPVQNVLPVLPGPDSINAAFLIMSASYIAFAIGLLLATRVPLVQRVESRMVLTTSTFGTNPLVIMLLMALGTVGFVLRFGSAASVLDYLRFGPTALPGSPPTDITGSATVGGAASSFLLPCLGIGCAMLWCRLIEERRGQNRWTGLRLVMLGATSVLILFSFSLFSYNRGAIVVPIVALAAAFSQHVRRIRLTLLLSGATTLFVAMLWLGSLRTAYYQADPYAITQTSLASVDPNKEIQVYGSGPQFLGYMIEISQIDGRLYMGGTLLPSVLYPVPVIGRPYRPFSGPVLYNYAVYGFYGVVDQIVPFDGELYWNFRLPGVIAGFVLIGIVIGALHRRFVASMSPWAAFVVMYAAIWTTFLIVGSLSVVAQIALYFGWPLISLAIAGSLVSKRKPLGSLELRRSS